MENNIIELYPGFRFHPTDEELVVHYLTPKIQSKPLPYHIPEADVCKSDPWDLPGDTNEEMYFFSTLETRYPCSKRANRTTPSGHWKASSIGKQVTDSQKNHIGTKKTFVFYTSKPTKGLKTDWFMNEYNLANRIHGVKNWVVCRVYKKKNAKKDIMKNVEAVQVRNTWATYYVPRNFDLNVDGGDGDGDGDVDGGESSCGSSGVTDEDEENNK